MNRRRRRGLSVRLLLAVALIAPGGFVTAEVGVDGSRPVGDVRAGVVLMGASEDPFPYPWSRKRLHAREVDLLNEDGDLHRDGPAYLAVARGGGPEVVWAMWDGNDYEIAWSRWLGDSWSPPEILTDNAVDDLDPSLVVVGPDQRKVAWWRQDADRRLVLMMDTLDRVEEVVAGAEEAASHPTIQESGGTLFVSYQRSPGAQLVEIVVSERTPSGWIPQVIADTGYDGPAADGVLDVRLHARGRDLWVDWVNAPLTLAYSRRTASGAWSAAEEMAYDPIPPEREEHARERQRTTVRLEVRRAALREPASTGGPDPVP